MCVKLNTVKLSGCKEIYSFAFHSCLELSKIIIPPECNYIGEEIFCNCSVLSRLEIPYGLKEATAMGINTSGIRKDTLNKCKNLRTVSIYHEKQDIPLVFLLWLFTPSTSGRESTLRNLVCNFHNLGRFILDYLKTRCQKLTPERERTGLEWKKMIIDAE